jgi:hypothetical protein
MPVKVGQLVIVNSLSEKQQEEGLIEVGKVYRVLRVVSEVTVDIVNDSGYYISLPRYTPVTIKNYKKLLK